MDLFMVVSRYYDGDRNFVGTNVVFYDLLCEARLFIKAIKDSGDTAQLYMWHDGPVGCYVYCNE